ncbi:hypothetical protein DFJ74DRAFT_753092 [Hyaloraphidium curvatum]|nr:hypothetical protein DFJ74DRAFT_753092 [Hyaloraphidium curvatum]
MSLASLVSVGQMVTLRVEWQAAAAIAPAAAEPAGLYYAGKFYASDYISGMLEAANPTFAKLLDKPKKVKTDSWVVLEDGNSFCGAASYDFEAEEVLDDVYFLDSTNPLKGSYTNANAKAPIKKITPDALTSDVTVNADGKEVVIRTLASNFIKMSSTAASYTVVDSETGAKGPVVTKVKLDAKKHTLSLIFKTALESGNTYNLLYNQVDTAVSISP